MECMNEGRSSNPIQLQQQSLLRPVPYTNIAYIFEPYVHGETWHIEFQQAVVVVWKAEVT